MSTLQLIEAILFYKGESISIKRLSEIIGTNRHDIETSLSELERTFSDREDRGIVLLRKDDEVMLGTAKEASPIIEKLIKEELHRDLGRAGLETLSIILYLGPISRSQIDYIRGVNSTFTLRNLLIRGLVERIDNPNDKRSFLYQATFELLTYLGVKNISELPEYASVRLDIEEKQKAKEDIEEEKRQETIEE